MDREKLRREMLVTFQAELKEHLETANSVLLKLESGAPQEEVEGLLAELLRVAHSLKGAARVVDVPDVEKIFHAMEDALSSMQGTRIEAGPGHFDILFQALDLARDAMARHLEGGGLHRSVVQTITGVLRDLGQGKAPPPTAVPEPVDPSREPATVDPEPPPPAPEPGPEDPSREPATVDPEPPIPETTRDAPADETIRMSTSKLDALMAAVGQLLVSRMRISQRLVDLRDVTGGLASWEKDWRRCRKHRNRLQRHAGSDRGLAPVLDFLGRNENHLERTTEQMGELVRSFDADSAFLTLLTDDLQDIVRRIRMLPVATLFGRFPRMVRDISRTLDKDVVLLVEGEETEVDRQVLELLADPLTHMLRNAVGHGIETPERRVAAQKPRRGTITLRALQQGNSIVVEVEDDGGGIDLDAVRSNAVRKGLIDRDDVSRVGDRASLDLIFQSGLSTQGAVSDISGRGVGLDVVRENLEKLGGQIEVNSRDSEGTKFLLTLPLTLATNHVLLVEVAGQVLAVPTSTVQRILRLDHTEVGTLEGHQVVRVDDRPIPLLALADVLELGTEETRLTEGEKLPAVVLAVADRRVAFYVDRLIGTEVLVQKPLGAQLKRIRNVAGAAILGSGSVVIILNVGDLMKSVDVGGAFNVQRTVQIEEELQRRILVVDDSITTRTLEKNILTNAGYHVLVAADGGEAWGILQTETFDAVVSDVDMPVMNGFALLKKVRAEERLRHLPYVLVTGKEKREDRIRGLEAGADVYMTKSTFDQTELLETLERLLG